MPDKTPRTYQILHGLHSMHRQTERDISTQQIEHAIRNGTAKNQPHKGERGGTIRRFESQDDLRKIVVIAEIVNQDCHVITTYAQNR